MPGRGQAGRRREPGPVRRERTPLKASLTGATVLALYLLPESLETLSPVFERDLGAGRPHRLPRLRDPRLDRPARPERGRRGRVGPRAQDPPLPDAGGK
ncbi:MAG: hypothetical protein M0C28_20335 [Candidatus Moduliflexus flocculans]|nr:hypothetical protein [Candidatus Moduliflexus flocculans]